MKTNKKTIKSEYLLICKSIIIGLIAGITSLASMGIYYFNLVYIPQYNSAIFLFLSNTILILTNTMITYLICSLEVNK